MNRQKRQVIFIMVDTQRTDMLGCYGNKDMHTPNLDKLAEQGLRYTNAQTCQPVCAPARGSIFTGLYPHANGIGCDILVRTEHLLPLEEYVLTCPLTRSDILRLGVEMCRALEDCHQKNILHRDIQLNRIYATKSGNFKLGDFAIPCVEASDLPSLGVEDLPHLYMAPELCKGEDYDHTVDIYALSLVLYQLLNKNRLAFVEEHRSWVTEGDLRKAQALRLSGASLPPPFFAKKGKLYKVLAKAAQPKAKDRYQSAQAFRRDLELLMPKKEDRIPLYPSIAPFQPQNFGKQSVIGAIFGLQPLRGLNSAETFGLF